jgi:RNA polymerase sigma factor (sigma-70 family)
MVAKNDKSFSNEADEHNREMNQEQKEVITKLLNVLTKREREIVENYYGLNNKKELTMVEIGKKYGISSERARQINKKSLRKLRSSMLMYKNMGDLLS